MEVLITVLCKAVLRNFGTGTLELADNTLKFTIEKGYFKKREEIVREIQLSDIKKVELVKNQLSITWMWQENKETTDVFIVGEIEPSETIYRKITEILNEQKRVLTGKEEAKQKSNEIKKILCIAIEIIDSLFDILKSLHGRTEWNNVENYLKRSEENAGNFKSQIISTMNLDFTNLSLTIKERFAEETAKEVYNILRSLYEYFNKLALTKDEFLEQIHPNFQDAKTAIHAYYILNDIILGIIVGDKEIEEENKELVIILDELSMKTHLKIDAKMLKGVINKLSEESGKQSVVEEIRTLFKQQLKELTLIP